MSSTGSSAFSERTVAAVGGAGLLGMAVLAPVAFATLQGVQVPHDAAATVANIAAAPGAFRFAIAAFLGVILLDVVVAWAFWLLLRPVHEALATGVAWLRVAYAATFAAVLPHLVDAVVVATSPATGSVELQQAQVMASLSSFTHAFDLALALFALHLLGLGALLVRAWFIHRVLAVLVVVSGAGYLVDAFGKILLADDGFVVSKVTFVGEALLILWCFWRAVRGFSRSTEQRSHVVLRQAT